MGEFMQSHIQMPKCVLAEFVNEKKSFYKYNVENGIINVGYPKRTFTSENYYSNAMEKTLNRHIESPLRVLLDFAKSLPTLTLPITLDNDILIIARTYVKSLIARSPSLFSFVSSESDFLELLSLQDRHDIVVDYAMKNKKLGDFYDRFSMSFVINETYTPFVLPTRGLYEYRFKEGVCLNVPLNPQCAIMLEEKCIVKSDELVQSRIVVIENGYDDVVMKMNGYAMQKQYHDKLGYVVCHDRCILHQLAKNIT